MKERFRVQGLGFRVCISGRARGARLFFKVRGAHPIARLRSFEVPPQPPKLCSFRVQGSYPPNPLARGASVFFVFSKSVALPQRHSQVADFRQKGFEQRIWVAEAMAGLHRWISWICVQDEVYKTFASPNASKLFGTFGALTSGQPSNLGNLKP